jgi:pimeloyl-ACP methyl ester carboxylesterase
MLYILSIIAIIYILVCLLLYSFQERFIFFPERLAADFRFSFGNKAEEHTIRTADNTLLHSLLFKADSARGVIFYLHGNAGSLRHWSEEATVYTQLGYDVFMPDYRGYGKSEGVIRNEAGLHADVQTIYNWLKKRYAENSIIVLGYSLGTGMAAKLAAGNSPGLLILQAPYYSLPDVMRHHYPIIPTFLLKYRLETFKWIGACSMPVVLFHGNRDEVIPYGSAEKLKPLLKQRDRFVTLDGGTHNGMRLHPDYQTELKKLLLP